MLIPSCYQDRSLCHLGTKEVNLDYIGWFENV